MKITMDGKYTTRDGRPVRILCVDGPGYYPVVGFIEGRDLVERWTHVGSFDHRVDYVGEPAREDLRDLIRERKMDEADRQERAELLRLYRDAIGA